jgi:hypothetical protein
VVTDLDEQVWTIGEALQFFDPQIPRRTLARLLAGLPTVGEKTLPNGGPPVAVYRCADVMKVHAQWWRRKASTNG